MDAVHLGKWDSWIRSTLNGNAATLSLSTAVKNDGAAPANAKVSWKILDPSGEQVATAEAAAQSIAADGSATYTATAKLASPALWSVDTPNLYAAVVTVEADGKTLDAEKVNFGVRTAQFTADKGFFLNGKPLKIQGTCNHQDHAGVGAAVPDALQWFRLAVLQRDGRQRRPHLAQHAHAGVGGSLRPHGHDDDVRDAPNELESRKHGAA